MKQGILSIYLGFILNREPLLVKGSMDRFEILFTSMIVLRAIIALRKVIISQEFSIFVREKKQP